MLGARRYLEIGVHRGKTFFAVDIADKVGVDLKFQFDIALRPPNERFYETTSDEWFRTWTETEPFDIIFIDGLHVFDQALRDFCNSLLLAHGKTVWLIDDTVPSDVYSAWPRQNEAMSQLQADFGYRSTRKVFATWHGDVFKLVFAIHDLFPMLTYRTILTGGKRQTVVWRQRRDRFSPFGDSIEALARLTYFDFRRHRKILRGTSEETAFKEIAAFCERPAEPSVWNAPSLDLKSLPPEMSVPGTPPPTEPVLPPDGPAPDEQSAPLLSYDFVSSTSGVRPSGQLRWSSAAQPSSVAIAGSGFLELDGSIPFPGLLVLSGTCLLDPFVFADMRIEYDGCPLAGPINVGRDRTWTFAATPLGSPPTDSGGSALAIDCPSGTGPPESGVTLVRISFFDRESAPAPAGDRDIAATIIHLGTEESRSGWYSQEAIRRAGMSWMSRRGELAMALNGAGSYRLYIPELKPLTPDILPMMQIVLGGVPFVLQITQHPRDPGSFVVTGECSTPEDMGESPKLQILFPPQCVRSPKELGLNEDRRYLTVAMRTIAIARVQ